VRRIERLVNLIAALLEARRPMTAEEIRTRIAGYEQVTHEAFRRTFERDKEALREMGVPLEVRKVEPLDPQTDGYIIPKDRYYLPDLDLEPDELAALRLAGRTVLGGAEAEAGLLKLSMGEGSESWGGPQVIAGANVGITEPRLVRLYGALLERRPVRFAYVDAHGRSSERGVEPWGLVHRAGHWYLVGNDSAARARRTFKLSRIDSRVEVGDGSYDIPESFDPSAAVGGETWEFGSDEVETAVVRFDRRARWWAEQNLPHVGATERADGSVDVEMAVGNAQALLGWIIGWRGLVRIESPERLRAQMLSHLRPWLDGAAP
jgi:proteasome accessory factor B